MCMWITRGRVDFNRDSDVISPRWHRVSNTLICKGILLAGFGLDYSQSGTFQWPVLWGTALKQLPTGCPEFSPDFPEPVCTERVCFPYDWITCSYNEARLWLVLAATGVPRQSLIQVWCMHNVALFQRSSGSWCYQHGMVCFQYFWGPFWLILKLHCTAILRQ